MKLKDIFHAIINLGRKNKVEASDPNHLTKGNLDDIKAYMAEKTCKLEITADPVEGKTNRFENIGIVIPEGTSVYEIMHATGNLKSAYEKYMQRPLDENKITQHNVTSAHNPTPAP